MAFGGTGYGLYAISLLVANLNAPSESDDSNEPSQSSNPIRPFNLFAGAWLGICAAMLWTAQGTIMTSYPKEDRKGHYFAWFWGIFNMGAVIGSLVRLSRSKIQSLTCISSH